MKRCLCLLLVLSGCKNNLLPTDGAAAVQGIPATPMSEPQPLPTTARVEGTIEVAPEVANHIKPGDTIFLIARHANTNAMVAVSKLSAPARFPMPFGLGAENIMTAGIPFEGPLKITARVDKDGDATTKNPGDVLGEVEAPVSVPAHGVVLRLGKLL